MAFGWGLNGPDVDSFVSLHLAFLGMPGGMTLCWLTSNLLRGVRHFFAQTSVNRALNPLLFQMSRMATLIIFNVININQWMQRMMCPTRVSLEQGSTAVVSYHKHLGLYCRRFLRVICPMSARGIQEKPWESWKVRRDWMCFCLKQNNFRIKYVILPLFFFRLSF